MDASLYIVKAYLGQLAQKEKVDVLLPLVLCLLLWFLFVFCFVFNATLMGLVKRKRESLAL